MLKESPSTILIVGDSITYWAARSTLQWPDSVSWGLGDRRVTVRAERGMKLHQLVGVVERHIKNSGVPGTLVICLGTNDLSRRTVKQNMAMISQSIRYLKKNFPTMFIVWSDILSRKEYSDTHSLSAGANCRKAMNSEGHRSGHAHIVHHNIRHYMPLYKDNVHLNDVGCRRFMGNILSFLQDFVSKY